MKKASFKHTIRLRPAWILFAWILLFLPSYANDFTAFPQDNTAGYLQPLSTAQQQTDITVSRDMGEQKTTPKELSLLRKANKERNGLYAMVVTNMIPIQRMLDNKPLYIFSMGMGVRTGVVSYLDKYIGMRGYFAFDFTNDKLSPLQHERANGTLLMISLGIDMLIDFFIDKNYKNTMGFFAGIGAGAFIYFDTKTPIHISSTNKQTTFIANGNVMVQGGFSAVFNYHHRIEIGVRFLPTQSLRVESDGIVADYNPYVAYSLRF